MSRFLITLFSCWFLSTASAAGADTVNWKALHGLGAVEYHTLERDGDFVPLHVFVRLPPDYDPAADRVYPTAFLLDGGVMFPILAGYQRHLELAEDAPPMIVVGLSYGTDDWRKGNARSTDFTSVVEGHDHWGGAPEFLSLLQERIVPLIEDHYAVDSNQRILFGQSLGGQFVLYTAMNAPDLFFGLIANNPALHRNLPTFLEQPIKCDTVSPPRLFVTSGEFDDPRFRVPALKWIDHWTAQSEGPWKLRTVTTAGHNHFSAAPLAYRQGLLWIIEPSQSTAD